MKKTTGLFSCFFCKSKKSSLRSEDIGLPKPIAKHQRVQTKREGYRRKCLDFVPPSTRRDRMLLGPKGIATRSKDATRGSWPYY